MTWGAVVVGVGSAVVGGISASQANKRASKAAGGLDSTIAYARQNPGVFGEKIDWESVDYTPLFREDPGYGNIAADTIAGSQRNLPAAVNLTRDTNKAITENDLTRIRTLYPGIDAAFGQQSSNTQNLLRGDIPAEDREMLTSRRTEAQTLGGGGVNPQQVAADLGLTRLDLMQQGAANLTNNVNLWDAISPQARQMLPQSLFVDVGEAVQQSVAENQFAAQFAQSERNAELAYALTPDPQAAGIMNLEAARAGLQAGNPQQSVFGAAATAGITGALSAYGGRTNTAAPARQAPTYVQTARMTPAYASPSDQTLGFQSLSGTNGLGVQPVATTANPYTGAAYAQQGSLGNYFTQRR